MTHDDAKASCRAQGGDLASLPTYVQAGMIGARLKCADAYHRPGYCRNLAPAGRLDAPD